MLLFGAQQNYHFLNITVSYNRINVEYIYSNIHLRDATHLLSLHEWDLVYHNFE